MIKAVVQLKRVNKTIITKQWKYNSDLFSLPRDLIVYKWLHRNYIYIFIYLYQYLNSCFKNIISKLIVVYLNFSVSNSTMFPCYIF